MSPHISINDGEEQWITPPTSPTQEEESTAAKGTLLLADTRDKEEVKELRIITKGTTWIITGANLTVKTIPNDNL